MTGNVWEWTCDYFRSRHRSADGDADRATDHGADGDAGKACCAPRNPRVGAADRGPVPAGDIPRMVIKGG